MVGAPRGLGQGLCMLGLHVQEPLGGGCSGRAAAVPCGECCPHSGRLSPQGWAGRWAFGGELITGVEPP